MRWGMGETAFKINIEIRTKWRGYGEGRIIIKSGADGKLFRLIFILFNDELFGTLPPWQMEVFLNDGLRIERIFWFLCVFSSHLEENISHLVALPNGSQSISTGSAGRLELDTCRRQTIQNVRIRYKAIWND
jgi:hypothetical protein